MKIRKGDKVKVLYGKDAGKIAKVLSVMPRTAQLVVEGVNVFKRHVKGDGQTKKSEIVEKVKPLHSSKVMVVCESCGKPTRVGMKLESDNYVRVCKNCGKTLDHAKMESKAAKKIEAPVESKKEEKVTKKTSKKTK